MGNMNTDSVKKGDVNPGLLRVPIGIWRGKWRPVRAPIRKVP